jgi:dimethylamine--corrinoid protein Co-methyltransferase
LTYVKETVKNANIPVHVNVGMGVGGVPMMESLPLDTVSRVSKALAKIGKIDGL